MSRRPRAETIVAEEALPEADRLEGFPHPRETVELYGHAPAQRLLAEAFAAGRMHHAWLLAGAEGIGKATLAYRFAKFALGAARPMPEAPLGIDPDSAAARQVSVLSHPGLLVIRRAYNQQTKRISQVITIDEVRRLRMFLGLSSAGGPWRVVIVDRADELNVNAANALLKSLEEPPSRTVFLLVSNDAGRLLPTIHSRCRRLDLARLGDADLAAAIAGPLAARKLEPPSGEAMARLAALSGGSVRRALELSVGGGLELHERILRLLGDQPGGEGVHKLADELAPAAAEPAFMLFFSLLQDLLGRAARQAATGAGAIAGEDRLAKHWATPDRLASLATLWETIAREKAQTLQLNLDRKALILETFRRIGQDIRPARA